MIPPFKIHGQDHCRICGHRTTFETGKPPVCGARGCQDEWQRRRIAAEKQAEASGEQGKLL